MRDHMLSTQKRPEQNDAKKQILASEAGSQVTWITSTWSYGTMTSCPPRVEFKIVLFWNGSQMDRILTAEPKLTQDGHFKPQNVLFRLIKEKKEPRTQEEEEIFTRDHVSLFNLSLSDNRLVKFSISKYGELIDVKVIFETVHKKH